MKIFGKWMLFFCLLTLFGWPQITVHAEKIVREIKVDFEGEKELPEGWSASNEPGFSFARVSDVAHFGKASGLFTAKEGKEIYSYPALAYEIPKIKIKKGEELTWELSFFVKSQLGTHPDKKRSVVYTAITYLNDKNSVLCFDQGCFSSGTADWKKMSMKGKVNEEAKKIFVQIILHGPGKAWVDDFHFVLKKVKAKYTLNHPLNHRKSGEIFKPEKEADFNEFIKVADDNWTFEGAKTHQPFIPWGTSLVFPYSKAHPKDNNAGMWREKVFDIKRIEKGFKKMQKLNVNLVKIALTGEGFLPGVTGIDNFKIDPKAINRFEKVLQLAKKYKLRLMVQSPNHWDGWPAWWDDQIGEKPGVLPVLLKFWSEFVPRYKNETAIFSWVLCVEKTVYFPGSNDYHKYYKNDFISYLKGKYKSIAEINRSWKTSYKSWENIDFAPNEINLESRQLFDTQEYREWVGVRWVREQTKVIRKHDPNHLIGSGFILSEPFIRLGIYTGKPNTPFSYGALNPRKIAKYLDFLDPHFYPVIFNSKKENMELLKATMRYDYAGKPLIFGEFSYGNKDKVIEMNKMMIESTIGLVSGWIPWAFHNPGMGDSLTAVGGLVENDFETVTDWGKTFRGLKRKLMLDSRKGIARDNYDPVYIKLDRRKVLCGSFDNEQGNAAYPEELIKIMRTGGRKVRFTEKPFNTVKKRKQKVNSKAKNKRK